MTKTFVKKCRVINSNFTEVPNPVQYNRDMNRTYQVNQLGGGGHCTSSIDGNWSVQNSRVELYQENDDNNRKSKLRKCLGIAFLLILMLSAITFMVLAIFYDEILDGDNENAEQYWDRIQKEIRLAHNMSKINELNRTLHMNAKKANRNRHNISKPGITYEEFTKGTLNPISFTSKWISSTELFYYDNQYNLCITNVSNMSKTIIMPGNKTLKQKIIAESLSPDRNYLLVFYNKKKVYRYSSLGTYRVYSIKDGNLSKAITPEEKPKNDRLNYVEWGPVGSQLIFVQDNDIYFKRNAKSPPIRLTKTGKDQTIYNGVPDWVYEEEIIGGRKTFWMSSDGKGLVFATLNDTQVDLMTWPWYGVRNFKDNINQYTGIKSIRYPKPGRPNPTVSLSYIPLHELREDTDQLKPEDLTIPIQPPKAISDLGEYLFTTFKWIDNKWFAINWMNRTQNFVVMVIYGIENDFKPITSFSLTSNNSWIDLFSPPLITPDGSSFLITSPRVSDNKRDTFTHIRRITIQITNESESQFLTSGVFEVKKILDINKETQRVYFMATFPENPGSKHLLSLQLNKSGNRSEPICHTCLMNTTVDDNGEQSCLTSEINFSVGAEYYIIECQGPGVPQTEIRRTSDHRLVHVLVDNRVLKSRLKNKSLPKRIFKKVSVGDHFVDVMLLVPEDFDEKAQDKYPIVFNVYGGPRHGSVTQTYYNNQFGSFLVSNRSVIYAMLDSRGSANHGYKFMIDIYNNFGRVEVEDTVAVAEYFRNQPYVDSNSVSIWGWSYGGYVTTMALESDVHYQNKIVFNCGIAVAPVTDWLYYDSVYVERYMGLPTPEGNLANYERSSTIQRVKHLNGKQFLIIFGTGDDNVHAMNSMMLLKAMNEANIKYQTQIYPDNNHGLQDTSLHFYQRMLDFFDQCFQQKS